MPPVVTVGLDGSPGHLAAARRAGDEAEQRDLTLRLPHARPPLAPEPPRAVADTVHEYRARRLVHIAWAKLRTGRPGPTVDASLVQEDAHEALRRAPSDSETPVLAHRGLKAVESHFAGDVGLPVVARAERPDIQVRTEPSPAQDVLGAAEGEASPVVGRRAHRRGVRPRLGPNAHAAPHHGRRPVAVVPHG
ncbi:universal stress protein [Streptomyces sp. NPDC056628]|uniref:universal stress protein n=1 Tax=Streptomyces sp. NPDC056628 TaxID=3345882 RepID=UPI0036AB8D37